MLSKHALGLDPREASDVSVQYPVHRLAPDADRERIQRVMLSPSGPEPIREADKVLLVDRIENFNHGALNDLILQRQSPAAVAGRQVSGCRHAG